MSKFTNIEYVEPKNWKERLEEVNNGERARYHEYSFHEDSSEEELNFPVITEVEDKYDWAGKFDKYFYTVVIKKEIVKGFKVTVKVAVWDEKRKKFSESMDAVSNNITKRLSGREPNYFHSYTKKLTPLSAEKKREIQSTQVLEDRYGVVIELGDFVAHPSGTYGGGSWVEVSKVEKFGNGTVNGWQPERLIVVKTDNQNKKLGW